MQESYTITIQKFSLNTLRSICHELNHFSPNRREMSCIIYQTRPISLKCLIMRNFILFWTIICIFSTNHKRLSVLTIRNILRKDIFLRRWPYFTQAIIFSFTRRKSTPRNIVISILTTSSGWAWRNKRWWCPDSEWGEINYNENAGDWFQLRATNSRRKLDLLP